MDGVGLLRSKFVVGVVFTSRFCRYASVEFDSILAVSGSSLETAVSTCQEVLQEGAARDVVSGRKRYVRPRTNGTADQGLWVRTAGAWLNNIDCSLMTHDDSVISASPRALDVCAMGSIASGPVKKSINLRTQPSRKARR